jgi:ubiquinone/menaquinone biosynthesis C-methylase UbiE
MKRVARPELLDTGSGDLDEIIASLHDMGRVHRWFGGVSTTEMMVRRVAQHSGMRKLTLLDVASGTGELPRIMAERLRRRSVYLKVTLLDRAPSHLLGAKNGVIGNALAMPFSDRQFDIVTSSLFVHHLEPSDVVRFINEALRVARIAVLINDLRRSRLHLLAACAALPIFRSPLTWHDAPASVRSAYTINELRRILQQTQAAQVEIRNSFLFRLGVIAWK